MTTREEPITIHLVVDNIVSDEGTIVIFSGTPVEGGNSVLFAVDHRMAEDLARAVMTDEYPEVFVEGWQVIG